MKNSELAEKLGTARLTIVEESLKEENKSHKEKLQNIAREILDIENEVKPAADWSDFAKFSAHKWEDAAGLDFEDKIGKYIMVSDGMYGEYTELTESDADVKTIVAEYLQDYDFTDVDNPVKIYIEVWKDGREIEFHTCVLSDDHGINDWK